MVGSMKRTFFLVLFALCTLWASEEVSGHFSIGREVKLPFREGHVNSQRNFESESHLRKNQRTTGNKSAIEAIFAILRVNLLQNIIVNLLYFSLIAHFVEHCYGLSGEWLATVPILAESKK